jgi:hypothetical protein
MAMRTNYPHRRSRFASLLGKLVVLALIVTAAIVSLSVAQQAPNPTNPPPTGPTPVNTTPANESFGQQVNNFVDKLGQGANDATRSIQEEFNKARDTMQSWGIEARVYSRLRWDKDLANLTLNVTSPSAGVIALSGSVSDGNAKTKAIRLAEDTVGVNKVVDQMTPLAPAATKIP